MRCKNCNCELENNTKFCPACGAKVNDSDEKNKKMQEDFAFEERKAHVVMEREKNEAEEWNEKVKKAIKTEKKIQFKLENLKTIAENGYPGIKKYHPMPATGNCIQESDNNKTKWLVVAIASAVAVISVFLSWFSIPLIAQYLGMDSSTSLIGSIKLLDDAMGLINDSWGLGESAAELNSMIMLLMFICIIAMVIPVLYGFFIWKYFRKEKEDVLAKWAGRSSLYGMIVSGIVILGTYLGNAYLNSELGSSDYGISFIKPETGAWLAFLLSFAVYILKRTIVSGGNETIQECNTVLEVINYDPTLLFRPVKLHISMNPSLLAIKLEFLDYECPYVTSATVEIHAYRNNGERIILPEVTLSYISNGKYLFGTITHYKIDFNGLKEARVFIKEYQVNGEKYRGSGLYADCDYSAEMLKKVRESYGNAIFKEKQEYGAYKICTCGQMYKSDMTECPLCGKK